MYRGFALLWKTAGTPEVRLFRFDSDRTTRPSLVSLAEDPTTGTGAVLLGQIFYREDLLAKLPRQVRPSLREASGAELALAVYKSLGRQGLEKIEGEYALAVWDGPGQRLYAQRDSFGCWPLYWSVTDGRPVVSTSLDALADLRPGGRSFNVEFLAEYLMQPMPADELPCVSTVYEGINRVGPGTVVAFGASSGGSAYRYWDWDTRIAPSDAGFASLDEAGVQFASLLRHAVRERLPRGIAAAHLSGGMDSSSVACLAREELSRAGIGTPLHTLSMVYERHNLIGERAYIDEVLRQGAPIESHLVPGDHIVHFGWFDGSIPRHEEPSGILVSMPFHRALCAAADGAGALTTLSGEGSDEILYDVPFHLADDLRRGHFRSLLRDAVTWSRGRNQGLWSVIRQFAFEPQCPVTMREGWRSWLRNGYGAWPDLGFFTIPPWMRPSFALKYDLRARGKDYAQRMLGAPTERSWSRSMLSTTSGDWVRWHLAAPRGITLSHPFRDPRIVSFVLGLSRGLRSIPGANKPLLQSAMKDVLPEKLRAKRQSPGFDDVYGMGLRANLPHLERMVLNSPIRDIDAIDAGRLIPAMREASVGIGDTQATDRLDKTLTLIAWFDQAVQNRSSPVPYECYGLTSDSRRVGSPPPAAPVFA